MKDPIKSIGTILDGTQCRDAIHIAIMPVIADEDVSPGDEVGIVYGTKNRVRRKPSDYGLKSVGIIDPFLRGYYVKKDQIAWMFLHPNTVTGMRHEWTHDGIDSVKEPANESEVWLRGFADKWSFDYDEMISGAMEKEGYVTARGRDLHSASELEPGDEQLFWYHIEQLTGRKFGQNHKENFRWSCSC